MVSLMLKAIKFHYNLVSDLDNSIVLFCFYNPLLSFNWRDTLKTDNYGDGGRIGDQDTLSLLQQ